MSFSINRYSEQADRRAYTLLASAAQQSRLHLSSPMNSRPGLSVIILNRDSYSYIQSLFPQLDSAAAHFEKDELQFEVLVGDTGSTSRKVLDYYSCLPSRFRIIDAGPYHFSANNNTLAMSYASSDIILCLNNDIEFPEPVFLRELYDAQVADPLAFYGSQLLYPNGTVQHGGVGFMSYPSGSVFAYHLRHQRLPSYFQNPQIVPALTGALLLLFRQDFLAAGGFSSDYTDECQDIDLCLRLHRLGLRAKLYATRPVLHHENGTRKKGEENWMDRSLFDRRWRTYLEIQSDLLPR